MRGLVLALSLKGYAKSEQVSQLTGRPPAIKMNDWTRSRYPLIIGPASGYLRSLAKVPEYSHGPKWGPT